MNSYETHSWHFTSTDGRAMDMQDPKCYGSILHKAFGHVGFGIEGRDVRNQSLVGTDGELC